MSVFGGPILRDGSAKIPLSHHQAALVGLVYGHGPAGLSRSRVIWLLWEEDDAPSPRHRLSQLLYGITRKVGFAPLFTVQGDVVLANECVESDLRRFEDLIGRKLIGSAAALLHDSFLPSIALTRELDDWKAARMVALRSRLREAAAVLWSDAESAANWTSAREAAETLLALDPDSETYLRCVMKARALCGAPEEAEAAYRAWVDHVPADVSASATELLIALERWRARSPQVQAAAEDPPFVGRKQQATTLRHALRQTPSDGLRVILVTGEAGIGKTRLVGEVCRELLAEGIPVARSTCSSLEQEIPLNPLIDILKGDQFRKLVPALDEPWRSVIRDLLPDSQGPRPDIPYIEPSAVPRRLYEAVRRFLSEIARSTAVLWIDDFQWVDHATAAALDFAHRRWDHGCLTLLLCARTPEENGASPGPRLISSLRPRATAVHLDELASDEAAALALSVLGQRLPHHSRSQLLGLTGSVPLYIVEVAHEIAEGRMRLDDAGDTEGPLPVRIQEIVAERLSLLQPVQRWVLELIAVGIKLPTEVVAETIDEREGVLLDALDRLMALRLITAEKGVLSCKHDLIRQGIYGSMTAVKRIALHKRIAEALLSIGPDQDPSQLALHFDRAEMATEAFRFAKAAADRAEEAGAPHEAIRFLRIARRNAPERAEGTKLLAREAGVRYRQAELEQALPLLTMAEQEFRELGDLQAATEWGIKRTFAATEIAAIDHREALTVLDRLMDDCEAAGLWEQFVECVETRLKVIEKVNDVPALKRYIGRLSRIPDTSSVRVRCLADLVRALDIFFGDGVGALAAAQSAHRAASEFDLEDLADRALHRLFVVESIGGTLGIAGEGQILTEGLRRATVSDAIRMRYRFVEAAGVWSLESAQLTAAERYFQQARELLQTAPEISDRVNMFGNLAEVSAMLGQFESAREYYARAYDSLRPQDQWRLRQIVHAGMGYCALELGDLRMARECEARIDYNLEGYFDPWMIVLFKVTLLKRRGDYEGAIEYLQDVTAVFDNRMRLVVIKLRLLECRLCRGRRPSRARYISNWLLEETQRLHLTNRYEEAELLAASLG